MTTLRRLLMVGVFAVVSCCGATPAWAHNVLSSVTPADSATVSPPDRVTFTFSEPARRAGTVVAVTAPDGTDVGGGDVQLVDDTVIQPLKRELTDGTYRVDWRVTSADGHPVSGRTSFTVTGGAALSAPVTTETSSGSDGFRTVDTYNVSFVWGPLILVPGLIVVVFAVLLIRRRHRGPRLR